MGQALADAVKQWQDTRAFALTDDAVERLQTLSGLWLSYARSMNLTGASTEEELTVHVLDGLDCVACVAQCGDAGSGPWLDVGSGGGFPGLVVAAVSERPMTLVEPRQKRAAFLDLALHAIERKLVGVFRARWGDSTWNEKVVGGYVAGHRMRYAVGTARAVFEPAEWLEKGMHVIQPGGLVVVHLAHGAESPRPSAICAKLAGTSGVVTSHRVPDREA